MIDLTQTLDALLQGKDLGEAQASELMVALADEGTAQALSGALLAALRAKGETPDEVRGFVRGMRSLAVRPDLPDVGPVVDTCGTGGDGSGSVNISTGVGLLAAACGVKVVKHGNRSVSSRSGSADVLAALGLPIPTPDDRLGPLLEEVGFTFLFAPRHHPATKAVVPVRRALGVRTVFNLIGPLANPVEPPYQLVGAYSLTAAHLMARTLSGLGIERAFVVHGALGWDEATPVGPFHLFVATPEGVTAETRDPETMYGLPRCLPEDLAGGDAEENAAALRRVLEGEQGAHRDALLLGAALVLEVIGRAESPREGLSIAMSAIDDGRALGVLDGLRAVGGGVG